MVTTEGIDITQKIQIHFTLLVVIEDDKLPSLYLHLDFGAWCRNLFIC